MINGNLKYKVEGSVCELYFTSNTDNGDDVHAVAYVVHDSVSTYIQNVATLTNAVYAIATLAEGDTFVIRGIGDEIEEEDYIKGVYTASDSAITVTSEHNISTTITLIS
jgi:hypothetical protein